MLFQAFVEQYVSVGEENFLDTYPGPFLVQEGRLFLEAGRTDRRAHCLSFAGPEERLVVGRKQASDICVPDGNVSGRHAALISPVAAGHCYQIEDLGSTNGTLRNGRALAPREPVSLRPEDVVKFGPFASFVFLDAARFASLVSKEANRSPEEGPPVTDSWSREALKAAAQNPEALKSTALAGLFLLIEGQNPIPLQAGVKLILGRSTEEADVVLPDTKVSRRHAELEAQVEAVTLTDLNSANGVFVGESRLVSGTPTPVKLGTKFRICDLVLSVVGQEAVSDGTLEFTAPPEKRSLVRGDLSQIGLGKLLLAVEARQKTGRLELEGRGWITFRAGTPWAAAADEGGQGVDAARSLLQLDSGAFCLDSNFVPTGDREIEGTFTRLLIS